MIKSALAFTYYDRNYDYRKATIHIPFVWYKAAVYCRYSRLVKSIYEFNNN
jgi:hypothetical protein